MLAVSELVDRLGVVSAIDEAVGPIKQRARGLSAGEFLVGVASAQMAGEDYLIGLDRRRADSAGAVLSPVPVAPSTTAATLARRFDTERWHRLEIALAQVAGRVLQHVGQERRGQLLGPVTLDLDATEVEVYGSRKSGVAYNYKGQRAGRPHLASWAEAGIVLGRGTGRGRSRAALYRLTEPDEAATLGGRLPAAMSVVLGYGSYDAAFATRVAEAVYDYETSGEDFPGSWRQVAGDHDGLTMPDESRRTDVMAGVMAMLGHSPDAGQRFFSGGPTTTVEVDGQEMTVTERLQYLIKERTWAPGKGSDEGEGLGAALRAATTEHRNRERTGQTSAELATQVFGLIAGKTRENNGGLADFTWGADNGWEMWRGMRDDVAAILADYAPDLFLVPGYGGEPSLTGDLYRDANDMFPDGLPYGALLTEHMVQQLMFTLGQDPEHVEAVTDGWAVANQVFQSHWAGQTAEDYPVLFLGGNGRDQLLNPLSQGAMVLDLLMDSAYVGDDADADKAEERAKAVQRALSMASALPILKPGEAVGEWGTYLIEQAKSQATTALGESAPGRSSTEDLNGIRDETADAAQRMFLNTLLGQGFFDDESVSAANERYQGLDLEPPPDGALLHDEDGTVTGFDFDSDEFRQWAMRNAPLQDVRGAVITAFGLEPR